MLSNLRAKGTRPQIAFLFLFRPAAAQNLGWMAMTAAIATCHSFAPAIVFFCRGGFALPAFRAKVAAVAALILALTLTVGLSQPGGKLSITVTGARNGDGVVRCALFNSPAAFPKIGQEWRGVIAPIRGGAATCVFTAVPAGTYAVAFFRAEHNETQLTTGLFGKPQQGYGFSNNAAGSFGPPNFNAAAFRYDGGNLMLQGSLTY
jgi:uncharacterized protein (DUF2141 family)